MKSRHQRVPRSLPRQRGCHAGRGPVSALILIFVVVVVVVIVVLVEVVVVVVVVVVVCGMVPELRVVLQVLLHRGGGRCLDQVAATPAALLVALLVLARGQAGERGVDWKRVSLLS